MKSSNRDIAVALSGGGYRAAHFHLGVLRKLHELGLLERVGVISSVSGGSILASLYVASRLRNETFEDFQKAAGRLMGRRFPIHLSFLLDFAPFMYSGDAIERALTRYLHHDDGRPILLEDLASVEPRLVVNATNVRTGAGWRFKSGGLGQHWELGTATGKPSTQRYFTYRCEKVTLARAVTASAAFPVFSAVRFDAQHIKEAIPPASPPDEHSRYVAYPLEKELQLPLLLSDGGVRDNTGVTSVIAGLGEESSETPYVIVSDAGVEARPIISTRTGWSPKAAWRQLTAIDQRGKYRKFSYLKRQFDIRGRHNNQMISLLALTDYLGRAGHRGIAMFRIDRAIDTTPKARRRAAELHEVRTRLGRLDPTTEQRLHQHGAELLWMRLTQYTPGLLTPDQYMPGVEPKPQPEQPPAPEVLS